MSKHRNTFPRGLVLGLTMAETAVLIIFVLLLALTTLLARETARRQAAEQNLERFETIREVLVQRGLDFDQLDSQAVDRRAADNWRELIRGIGGQIREPSPPAVVSQLERAHEIDELLDEAGLKPSLEDMRTLAAILGAGREADLTADDLREAIGAQEALSECRSSLDRADGSIARLEAQVDGGGRGTDHPSCWYDADKSVAYLFDVALTDEGFVLRAASAPEHHHKRRSLPLADIVTGRVLSTEEFLAQTRSISRWSIGQDCRFFVRAFDLTASDQKEIYKTRMRTLESRFYKNASPSGPPPSVLPTRPLP